MHSLEVERRALNQETDCSFSVYREFRAAMYAGVTAMTAGIGLLLTRNIDRIGPRALLAALALAAAACYGYALWAQRRAGERAGAGAVYVLFLGALIASAAVGYGESQFHWLGAGWSRHLLLLTALHGATAYAFESPLVLSLSLSALAGWIGVEPRFGSLVTVDGIAPAAGGRALLCAASVFAWRAVHRRLRGGAALEDVLCQFAINLAGCGGLSWCASPERRDAGLLIVLGLAAVTVRAAFVTGRELFAVYGGLYAAAALLIVESVASDTPLLMLLSMLATVTGTAALLWWFHRALKPT